MVTWQLMCMNEFFSLSFKKYMVNFVQVQFECIHEGCETSNEILTLSNLWFLHTCPHDSVWLKFKLRICPKFIVILISIRVFINFFFFVRDFPFTEITKLDSCMLPWWQLDVLLHSLSSALVPLQCFPPFAGSGLVHSLSLVCIPPTGLVQILHEFHSPQPSSTEKKIQCCK